MDAVALLALVFAIVVVLNLAPALAPPTWAVLVVCDLRWDLDLVPLVVVGAAGATLGRVALAKGTRRVGTRLPRRRRESLEAASALLGTRAGIVGSMAFFLLSPVPSAQLWEAAGLASRLRLAPLAAAFLAGRLVSYTLYVTLGRQADESVRTLLSGGLLSLRALLVQAVSVLAVVAFVLVDWASLAARLSARRDPHRARSGRARPGSRGRASA